MIKSIPYTTWENQGDGEHFKLDRQDISLLRSFGAGSRHLLKKKCGVAIKDELWADIKKFGYPLAAFLVKEFTWELACLIEDQKDVTQLLLELSAQPEVENTLTKTELMLLKMYVVVFVNGERFHANTVSC